MSLVKADKSMSIAGREMSLFDLAMYGDTIAQDWVGVPLDETTTPKLSELPLNSFVNAEATIYPDGCILGSNDLGTFEIQPNGEMKCTTVMVLATGADIISLPLLFLFEPYSYYCTMTGASHSRIVYAYKCSKNTISVVVRALGTGVTTDLECYSTVHGRWK